MNMISTGLLEHAFPSEGFLKDYLDYATPLTDAPAIYHLFTGLTTLAVSLGNRVYIPFGAQRIYPNLWIILLGKSSFYRKTYSMSIGRNILDKFDEHLVLPDEFSPERFFEKLSAKPQGLLTWSEFGGALSNFERSYMIGIKEFLTDLFDCRPRYKRELRGNTYTIENPCISILSCSTPEWLRSKIKEEDIRGGFFARFIFVPSMSKTKRLAIPPMPDKTLENRIANRLNELKKISGEVDISMVHSGFESWIFEHEAGLLDLTNSDLLSGFYTRLGIYTLKFAMLFQISEHGNLIISTEAMSKAITLTEFLKKSILSLFDEDLAIGKDMQDKAKVFRLIRSEPGILRSKLTRYSNLPIHKLDPLLNTLKVEERIKEQRENSATHYYAV